MSSIHDRLTALRGRLKGERQAGEAGEAWDSLLDLCHELADRLADQEEAQEDLNLYLETIDEDLTRLEGQLYGIEDDEEEDEADLTCPYCQRAFKAPCAKGDGPG